MDEATQVSLSEAMFAYQVDGEDVTMTSLSATLEANSDDPEHCAWLRSAPVGGCRMWGGGGAPTCWVRRIS